MSISYERNDPANRMKFHNRFPKRIYKDGRLVRFITHPNRGIIYDRIDISGRPSRHGVYHHDNQWWVRTSLDLTYSSHIADRCNPGYFMVMNNEQSTELRNGQDYNWSLTINFGDGHIDHGNTVTGERCTYLVPGKLDTYNDHRHYTYDKIHDDRFHSFNISGSMDVYGKGTIITNKQPALSYWISNLGRFHLAVMVKVDKPNTRYRLKGWGNVGQGSQGIVHPRGGMQELWSSPNGWLVYWKNVGR